MYKCISMQIQIIVCVKQILNKTVLFSVCLEIMMVGSMGRIKSYRVMLGSIIGFSSVKVFYGTKLTDPTWLFTESKSKKPNCGGSIRLLHCLPSILVSLFLCNTSKLSNFRRRKKNATSVISLNIKAQAVFQILTIHRHWQEGKSRLY